MWVCSERDWVWPERGAKEMAALVPGAFTMGARSLLARYVTAERNGDWEVQASSQLRLP